MGDTLRQFEFRDGALFLVGLGIGELRLQWYPVPTTERRLGTGKWLPYQPEFRVLAPLTPQLLAGQPDADAGRLQAKHEAFQAFRATIPEHIVKAVEPFTCHQWPLMTLLKRSPAACDLVKANPVLAYAVANNAQLQSKSGYEVSATQYSRLKQREILRELGLPDTEAMVRIFKKIPIPIVYPGLIRKLRQCVVSPKIVKILGHLPSINTGTLFVACQDDMATLVTPKLMQEIVGEPDEVMSAPTADLLAEIVTFAAVMHKKTLLRPFVSRRKVQECHDQLMREHQAFETIVARQKEIEAAQRRLMANHAYKGKLPAFLTEHAARFQTEYKLLESQRPDRIPRPVPAPMRPFPPVQVDLSRLRALRFPAPPIPGTDTIIPLTSFAEFESEAASQSICLGVNYNYLARVMRGENYVYRVLAPERHTLCIVKRGNNCWQIAELRQAKNVDRTESTENAVRNWLNANQISL